MSVGSAPVKPAGQTAGTRAANLNEVLKLIRSALEIMACHVAVPDVSAGAMRHPRHLPPYLFALHSQTYCKLKAAVLRLAEVTDNSTHRLASAHPAVLASFIRTRLGSRYPLPVPLPRTRSVLSSVSGSLLGIGARACMRLLITLLKPQFIMLSGSLSSAQLMHRSGDRPS